MFGAHRIGRARSFQAFAMVVGSAVGPVVYGLAMDSGVTISVILTLSGCFMLLVMSLTFMIVQSRDRRE